MANENIQGQGDAPDQTISNDSDESKKPQTRRRSTGMHPFDLSEESLRHLSELNQVASSESDGEIPALLAPQLKDEKYVDEKHVDEKYVDEEYAADGSDHAEGDHGEYYDDESFDPDELEDDDGYDDEEYPASSEDNDFVDEIDNTDSSFPSEPAYFSNSDNDSQAESWVETSTESWVGASDHSDNYSESEAEDESDDSNETPKPESEVSFVDEVVNAVTAGDEVSDNAETALMPSFQAGELESDNEPMSVAADGFDSYDLGSGFTAPVELPENIANGDDVSPAEPVDTTGFDDLSYDVPAALSEDPASGVPDPDDAVYSNPERVVPILPDDEPNLDSVFESDSQPVQPEASVADSVPETAVVGQPPIPRGLSGEIPTDLIDEHEVTAPPAFPDDPGFPKAGGQDFGAQAVTQLSGEVPVGEIADVFGLSNDQNAVPQSANPTDKTAIVQPLNPELLDASKQQEQQQQDSGDGDSASSSSLLDRKKVEVDGTESADFSPDKRKRSGFLRRPSFPDSAPTQPESTSTPDPSPRSPSRRVGFLRRDRDEAKPRHKPTGKFTIPTPEKPAPEADTAAPGRIRQDALEEIFKRWNDLKKKNGN